MCDPLSFPMDCFFHHFQFLIKLQYSRTQIWHWKFSIYILILLIKTTSQNKKPKFKWMNIYKRQAHTRRRLHMQICYGQCVFVVYVHFLERWIQPVRHVYAFENGIWWKSNMEINSPLSWATRSDDKYTINSRREKDKWRIGMVACWTIFFII